jgi:hypothetical protein
LLESKLEGTKDEAANDKDIEMKRIWSDFSIRFEARGHQG